MKSPDCDIISLAYQCQTNLLPCALVNKEFRVLKVIVSVIILCLILTALGYWAMDVYMATRDVELGFHGKLAMALGIFFTFLIGIALMTLVFMSNRRGHDIDVHNFKINDGKEKK